MEKHYYSLPNHPCTSDMWDELARENRPIVVYGMGNGADKLIKRFEKYGIEISDFFASDGFVRGHFFHGKRVKSFSEIKETYSDFVIVLSFASSRSEVIELFLDLDSKYDLYIPDMPVAGEEYFDRDFYNYHYSDIVSALDSLADDESRKTFVNVVRYKLTGKLQYLEDAYVNKDELYALLDGDKFETIIDAGAYNGDTVREAKAYFPNLKTAYAIEPDSKTFKKLTKYSEAERDISVISINAAVCSENGESSFLSSGNRNSSISSTYSYEHKNMIVRTVTVDGISPERVDYIKYDVEGAEMDALLGSAATIEKFTPTLLISAYHRSGDIYSIINYFSQRYPAYSLYVRRLRAVPAWELDVIAIPCK